MKAVIFDLDGVLFDTEPMHRAAWMNSLKLLGHSIDEDSLIEWTGVPCRALAERYADALTPKRPWEAYYRAKTRELKALVSRQLAPYPGLPARLTELSRSFSLGFATSNYRDDAELMLNCAGINNRFQVGICYDDTVNHKPDPEPYRSVAHLLGENCSDCYALEDSPSGLASAKAAGMRVLAVTSTYPAEKLSGADMVFPATVEACRFIIREGNT